MLTFQIPDSRATTVTGFDINWLPSWAYDYVHPKISRNTGSVELEAGPYIGAIPLLNEAILYIIPRAGHKSFGRMLLLSEGLDKAMNEDINDLVSYQSSQGEISWVRLLARPFTERLRGIEKESLLPGRRLVHKKLSYAKGRLSVVPTLKSLTLQEPLPVHCLYSEKIYDTAENRFLAEAADVLLRLREVQASSRHTAARWASMRQGKMLRPAEMNQVISRLSNGRYTGPRAYYISALTMAKLILVGAGISLKQDEHIEAESLLTNVALLFEKYVRKVLVNQLSPQGLLVEKIEGGVKARHLFLDGTCELNPDIVVSDRSSIRLIADVKYKTAKTIDPADYYQMNSYLERYDCNTGLLILARSDEEAENPKSEVVYRDTPNGKRVYELRLPVTDFERSEELLRDTVEKVISANR